MYTEDASYVSLSRKKLFLVAILVGFVKYFFKCQVHSRVFVMVDLSGKLLKSILETGKLSDAKIVFSGACSVCRFRW